MHDASTDRASAPTHAALVDAYVHHAHKIYRRRDGSGSGETENIRSVLARWVRYVGPETPARLTRHQVRAWLDQLAAENLSRCYVNKCLSILRRCVRWAVDVDLLPLTADGELRLVKGLRPLRSPAREPEKRRPPALSIIEQLLAHLPPVARDVLQLQMLTGARPSELLELTCAEVHSNPCRLEPLQHKTAHHGHARIIPLCARAAAIIARRWRPLCPLDRLFPGRDPSKPYSIEGYRAALARASKRAQVAPVRPYDVRHAVGRSVRLSDGLTAAQALLGHADASTTEIYAPADVAEMPLFNLARDAAERLSQDKPAGGAGSGGAR
jgi:integrase